MRTILPVLLLSVPALAGGSDLPEVGADDDSDRTWDMPEDVDGQIINGRAATVDEFPSAGGILATAEVEAFGQKFDVVLFMCSSTLIAPDVVLTAAHCVDEEFLTAQTGGVATISNLGYAWSPTEDLSTYGLGGPTDLPPEAVVALDSIEHPDFVGSQGVQVGLAVNNDIGLIFLDEPVLDIPHAYLPTADEVDQLVVDAPVTIVGWGQQVHVSQGQQPPAGTVGIKQLAETWASEIGPTEFQVGANADDGRKCHGDSGGPSYQEVETDSSEAWRVVGVTSHAYDMTDCASKGGVDTRVSAYLDWIDEEMRSRCEDGTRVWCEEPGIIEPPARLDEDPEDGLDEEDQATGCSCNGTSSTPLALTPLLLLGLALFRRRR